MWNRIDEENTWMKTTRIIRNWNNFISCSIFYLTLVYTNETNRCRWHSLLLALLRGCVNGWERARAKWNKMLYQFRLLLKEAETVGAAALYLFSPSIECAERYSTTLKYKSYYAYRSWYLRISGGVTAAVVVVRAMKGVTNSVSLFTSYPQLESTTYRCFEIFPYFFCRQEYARNNFSSFVLRHAHTSHAGIHLCLTLEFVCHIFHFGLLSPLTLTDSGKYNQHLNSASTNWTTSCFILSSKYI